MAHDLSDLAYDPLLEEGARNAVRTCLDVQKDERAVLIADRGSHEAFFSDVWCDEAVEALGN